MTTTRKTVTERAPGGGMGQSLSGLVGNVDPESFKNILEGLSPDGARQLVQTRTGKKLKRRGGF